MEIGNQRGGSQRRAESQGLSEQADKINLLVTVAAPKSRTQKITQARISNDPLAVERTIGIPLYARNGRSRWQLNESGFRLFCFKKRRILRAYFAIARFSKCVGTPISPQ